MEGLSVIRMHKIAVDVYGYNIYFSNGISHDKFKNMAGKKFGLHSDQFSYNILCVYSFFNNNFPENLYDTCILYSEKKLKFNKKSIDMIVHEITHIKNLIFQRRGIHSESGNDEHEAVLNEFLMKKIIQFI